jgi:hypothetical protein
MVEPTDEAAVVAIEAYIYLFPLVIMELTRRQATNVESGTTTPGRSPMNEFAHIRAFPGAEFKAVVRPNFDTLYSSAFLDLTIEPVVVSVPDTDGRYYLLPMLDMWTDVFATPGKRTSGTAAASWAVVPPGWNEELPSGVEQIDATTPYVWIIGRTQTNGPADYPSVHRLQDGLRLTRLSEWGRAPSAVPSVFDPTVDMTTPPLDQVNAMDGPSFFRLGAELMKLHRPHATDWSVVRRMRNIGLEVGQSWDHRDAKPEVQRAVEAAPEAARKQLMKRLPTMANRMNGWQMNVDSMGVYGDSYAKRAVVAMFGLGANQAEDSVYPLLITDADGARPDGSHDYVLHFAANALPPVDAFWSVTMYDARGFPVANELNRFALGDRDPLTRDADGSVDLYIQHSNPGHEKEANWLPAAQGPLGITMRLYGPRPEVLLGQWAPPPLQRVT